MPKKRNEALSNLMNTFQEQDITNEKSNPTEVGSEESATASINKKTPPKSRVVSNIPWYPKSVALKKELKLIALHEDTTLTGLLDEGIKMVLERRGKNMDDYI